MKNKLLIITLLFAYSCNNSEEVSLPYFNTPAFEPEWITPDESTHTIAPFSFINQHGEVVTNNTTKGKIYVADFFFTTCGGICPKMTNNMSMVQEAFKNDTNILILSYSVTPEMDNEAVLQQYAQSKGVGSNWHLLTGDKATLYKLARESYFADEDIGFSKSVNDFLHTENFILVDTKGYIRGVYKGTKPLEVKQLIEDIKTLKKEN